jgi:HK97 family phage prohead protease
MNSKRYATASLKALGDDAGWDFESVLSAPTLDRDGEVIDVRAFDPLPSHIPIDVDHAMTVEKTVASGEPFYADDGTLMFRGNFAGTPLGQVVRTLVKEGHIRSMSVAFMNARTEVDPDDERVHIRQAELLNAGIVAIPSNREALIGAVKSLAEDIAPESTNQTILNGLTYAATSNTAPNVTINVTADKAAKALADTNAALKAAEVEGARRHIAVILARTEAMDATVQVLR